MTKEDIKSELLKVESDSILELKAVSIGLDYATARFFEISDSILEERISRLEAGPSLTEELLWLSLSVFAGGAVAKISTKLLAKILSNHVLHYNSLQRISPNTASKIQKFFGVKEFSMPSIKVNEFLTKDTVWGKLYRYAPEIAGSRVDEIVQGGPRTNNPWPPLAKVADLLLHNKAWLETQLEVNRREFILLREAVDAGDLKYVKDQLDQRRMFLQNSFGFTINQIYEDLVFLAREYGEFFLLTLFAKLYGPSKNLMSYKKVGEKPTQERAKRGGYRKFIFDEYKGGKNKDLNKSILNTLNKSLINPNYPERNTYYVEALNDIPGALANPKNKFNVSLANERANVDLALDMDNIITSSLKSPLGNIVALKKQ